MAGPSVANQTSTQIQTFTYTQTGIIGTPLVARYGEAWRYKVLHSLLAGPGVRFYAGDGPDSEPMKGCALYVEIEELRAAETLFASLSEGGRITVPLQQQFWGDHYGNFTDRFGVQWAVGCARHST